MGLTVYRLHEPFSAFVAFTTQAANSPVVVDLGGAFGHLFGFVLGRVEVRVGVGVVCVCVFFRGGGNSWICLVFLFFCLGLGGWGDG